MATSQQVYDDIEMAYAQGPRVDLRQAWLILSDLATCARSLGDQRQVVPIMAELEEVARVLAHAAHDEGIVLAQERPRLLGQPPPADPIATGLLVTQQITNRVFVAGKEKELRDVYEALGPLTRIHEWFQAIQHERLARRV
jgi:hypothetical protein